MRELGFYYPGYRWRDDSLAKSLLLFFDGIALLVPERDVDEVIGSDPYLTQPLVEQGLLSILTPESLIDDAVAERLGWTLAGLIDAGLGQRIADLRQTDGVQVQSGVAYLSQSRALPRENEVMRAVFDELSNQGLARISPRRFSVEMHPILRNVYLVLYSQLLRGPGRQKGLDLQPATDQPEVHTTLAQVFSGLRLEYGSEASWRGRVFSSDLRPVGLDLSLVPLEEVLAFRAEQGAAFRTYRSRVREVAKELAEIEDDHVREHLLDERRDEIEEALHDLRARSVRSFGANLGTFALGVAGAVLTAVSGEPGPAAVATAAAGLQYFTATEPDRPDAYSYLFSLWKQYG